MFINASPNADPLNPVDPPVDEVERRAAREALKYLFTWLGIFLAGGLLGITMRSQQANLVNVGSSTFYTLMTMHGQFMFIGLGTFGMMGVTWYVLAKVLHRDLDYKFIDAIYWILVLGFALIGISGLYGGFAAGWYFLYPLPLYATQDGWTLWGVALFSLGELLVGLGIILYTIEVLMVVSRQGGRGIRNALNAIVRGLGFEGVMKSRDKFHVSVFPLTANALDMLVATIPLAVLLVVMFVGSAFDPSFGLNVGLADNMFWFFGHPIVYQLLFPAIAAMYFLFQTYSSRKWIGYAVTGGIWVLAAVTNLLVWGHHLYLYPFQPLPVNFLAQLSTMGISIVSAVSIYSLLAMTWKGGIRWDPPMLFTYMAIFAWLEGGFSGVAQAIISWNLYLHNTLWVVGHFHLMALMVVAMTAIAMIYYIVPRVYPGVNLYDRWSKVHFWMSLVGGFGFTNVWIAEGILGVPRRYAYHYMLAVYGIPVPNLDLLGVIFAIILGIAQGIFAVKLFNELVIKRIKRIELEIARLEVR